MDRKTERSALMRELQALREENQRLRRQLLQGMMEKAVADEILSVDVTADMERFFDAPSPWYMMLLFYGKLPARPRTVGAMAESPMQEVSRLFTPVLTEFGQPFFFMPAVGVACLLNVSRTRSAGSEARAAAERELPAALSAVLERGGSTAYICMSRISELDSGPRMLYRAATSVAEHRTEDSPAVCGEWDMAAPSPPCTADVYQLELQFWQQLQRLAFFEAAGTLDQLMTASVSPQGALERVQAVVFSRLELVLQSNSQRTGTDLMRDPDFSRLMLSLPQAQTFQALRDAAHDVLALLEDKVYTPSDLRNRKMVSIEAYIRRNYAEQSLGAAAISEEFKISTSYLSRIFRADMGMSVVDFIHQLRVREAKTLLLESGSNLNDIAQAVGFSNRWVFIRAFKQLEGMTPGAYRERG